MHKTAAQRLLEHNPCISGCDGNGVSAVATACEPCCGAGQPGCPFSAQPAQLSVAPAAGTVPIARQPRVPADPLKEALSETEMKNSCNQKCMLSRICAVTP